MDQVYPRKSLFSTSTGKRFCAECYTKQGESHLGGPLNQRPGEQPTWDLPSLRQPGSPCSQARARTGASGLPGASARVGVRGPWPSLPEESGASGLGPGRLSTGRLPTASSPLGPVPKAPRFPGSLWALGDKPSKEASPAIPQEPVPSRGEGEWLPLWEDQSLRDTDSTFKETQGEKGGDAF